VHVRELTDRATEAVALNNIGLAWSGLGEYQKALDAYTAALEINESLDSRWNVAINLNNIAWVYGQSGNLRQALRFYQRSLELVRNAKDQRRTASVLNNIADIHTELGEYRKAVETHSAAPLWDIDDRATAETMKRFYEGMLARSQRPAAALRAAQIAMWNTKGWEAPYYWAPFTLEGEWR
jgi:tetratricopeptide (TPR) repeat protein